MYAISTFAKMLQYVKSDIFSLQEGTPNLTIILYTRLMGKPVPVYFVHLLCSSLLRKVPDKKIYSSECDLEFLRHSIFFCLT